jgi:hypothetical protein
MAATSLNPFVSEATLDMKLWVKHDIAMVHIYFKQLLL